MIKGAQIFIFFEEKLLIAKRSNIKKIAPNRWNIIGGKIEDNENIYQGAIREIKEEVNLNFYESDILFLYDKVTTWLSEKESKKINFDKAYFNSNVFLTISNKNLIKNIKLNKEHSDFKLVNLDEALNINIVGFTKEEIKLIFKIQELKSKYEEDM
jgi:8-oxo-dGTP pyrophosphatase MutT (NUDIX family)